MTVQKLPCGASPDCLHLSCEHCGVGIRTGNDRAIHHPGTRSGTLSSRKCGPCKKRGGPPPATPKRCKDCRKPFRGRSESLDDRPGTVRHEGHGQCVDCFRNERRAERAAYDRENHRLKRQKKFEANEDEIRDERHVLLSDKEMSHMAKVSPKMYDWHLRRRKRLKLGEYS